MSMCSDCALQHVLSGMPLSKRQAAREEREVWIHIAASPLIVDSSEMSTLLAAAPQIEFPISDVTEARRQPSSQSDATNKRRVDPGPEAAAATVVKRTHVPQRGRGGRGYGRGRRRARIRRREMSRDEGLSSDNDNGDFAYPRVAIIRSEAEFSKKASARVAGAVDCTSRRGAHACSQTVVAGAEDESEEPADSSTSVWVTSQAAQLLDSLRCSVCLGFLDRT
eukprot:4103145-Pleurochrysis_carterae.AAC.2